MRRVTAALVVSAALGLVACTSDDTVQESVDGGYFPSDAAAQDSTLPSEGGEDGGGAEDAADSTVPVAEAGHDGGVDAAQDAAPDATTFTDASGKNLADAGDDAAD